MKFEDSEALVIGTNRIRAGAWPLTNGLRYEWRELSVVAGFSITHGRMNENEPN